MGQYVSTNKDLKIGKATIEYENGVVSSIFDYLGYYTMELMDDDCLRLYKGKKVKKVFDVDDLDLSRSKKKELKNAISKIKNSLEPYNCWFSLSNTIDFDYDKKTKKFKIDDSVKVWEAGQLIALNNLRRAEYQSFEFPMSLSLDLDNFKGMIKFAAALVGVILAIAVLAYLCLNAAAEGVFAAIIAAAAIL